MQTNLFAPQENRINPINVMENILGSSAVLNRKLKKEKKRSHSLREEIALVRVQRVQRKKKKLRRQEE